MGEEQEFKSAGNHAVNSSVQLNESHKHFGSDLYKSTGDSIPCASPWVSFLATIQSVVNAQVCSLFLLNDAGEYERVEIYGKGKDGTMLQQKEFPAESYLINPNTPNVGKLIQFDGNADYLFENCVTTSFKQSDLSDDKTKEVYDEIKFRCGDIKSIALLPVQIHGKTYGILRVFNRISDESSGENNNDFSIQDHSYLMWMASKIENYIMTKKFSCDIRILSNIHEYTSRIENLINRSSIPKDIQLIENPFNEYCSVFSRIIYELVDSKFSPIKAANLRLLKRRDPMENICNICVAHYTKNEDGHKNRYPRYAHDETNLSIKVVRTGDDILIRDVTKKPMLSQFIRDNREWIIKNKFNDFLCIPIKVNNVPVGTLSLFTSNSRRLSVDDCEYYKEIARALSVLISNIYAHHEHFDIELSCFINSFLDFVERTRTPTVPDPEKMLTTSSLYIPPSKDETESESDLISKKKYIFISSSHDDVDIYKALDKELACRGYVISSSLTMRDRKLTGYDSSRALKSIIQHCSVFLLILSSCSVSTNIQSEWELILEAFWNQPEILIIPILLDSVQIPVFLTEFRTIALQNPFSYTECALEIIDIINNSQNNCHNLNSPDDKLAIRSKYRNRFNLLYEDI